MNLSTEKINKWIKFIHLIRGWSSAGALHNRSLFARLHFARLHGVQAIISHHKLINKLNGGVLTFRGKEGLMVRLKRYLL